jgi:hypothetical protein
VGQKYNNISTKFYFEALKNRVAAIKYPSTPTSLPVQVSGSKYRSMPTHLPFSTAVAWPFCRLELTFFVQSAAAKWAVITQTLLQII